MRITLMLIAVLIAGCSHSTAASVEQKPLSNTSYLDACKLVDERQRELDEVLVARTTLRDLGASDDTMNTASEAVRIRRERWAQAVLSKERLEPNK